MSANDNNNKYFWLAYCDIIKKQIGQLDPGFAIFYSTKNQRGPPVQCPESYTNFGIYNIGGNLLSPYSLFYAPSATDTYYDLIASYLSWVDVGGNPNDAAKLAVVNSKTAFEAYDANFQYELNKAAEEFTKKSNLGLIPQGLKFVDWLAVNGTAYNDAEHARAAAAGKYKSAMLAVNGPLSAQWGSQMNLLIQSKDPQKPLTGFNMPVCASTPPSITDIYNAKLSRTKLPDPTNVYYVPAYSCPDYAGVVKSWEDGATKAPKKTNRFPIKLEDGKSVREESFGHVKMGAGGNFDFGFVDYLGFGADASSDTQETTLTTEDISKSIEMEMFWDDMASVAINPGNWNVSNPRGNYPNLKEGAPKSVQYLARPSKLLLVSKLGYTVRFKGSVAETFARRFEETKSGGGYIRVFGVNVAVGAAAVGGQGSSTKAHTTHSGSWNSASGEFTIEPSQDAGFATILAVVGEIVQTF